MDSPIPVAFGTLLKHYRLAASLTQEALAERAGVSARNIQNLERGENKPLQDTARRLAAALALGDRERALLLAAVLPVPRRRAVPEAVPAAPATAAPLPRHNLPAALSSFIGRAGAQAQVRAGLAGSRLVTLTGTGGVGKTRLALRVAAALVEQYADGVWWVELAPLTDPAQLPGAVASTLGLREEAGRSLLQTLTTQLATKQLLLVLDNCEHLVAGCAALASALLRAAPGLRLLATSREALAVAGERRYRVPSLSVPDLRQLPPPEVAGSFEAVRLFVERAQERRDGFVLEASTARAVAEICARLDGVPLAIELAAARTGSLGVAAIAARLDDRFRLLTGGARDLPSRQQTLRATLDWSWELLEEAERRLLGRLSVFAGGWTLAAAEVVCAAEPEVAGILDALDGLVNRSLVQVEESGEEAGRYRLLETVRQYAAERLAAAGEEAATRDRHLAWCLDLVEEETAALRGAAQKRALAVLEGEHDNLRAALAWACESGSAEVGLRLAGTLARFWDLHSHYGEGRSWLEALLAMGVRGAPTVRARALDMAGMLAYRQGDFARAQMLAEAGLTLRRELTDRSGIARSLNTLGLVAQQQGDYAQARALHGESLALRRELGDREGIAVSLDSLGNVAGMQGDLAAARALHEESLIILRALGDPWEVARALGNLAVDVERAGDLSAARVLGEESLALRRELGDRWGMALALGNLGDLARLQGDYAQARASLEESLALRRALGDRWGMALGLAQLGGVAAAQGDYAQARALHGESLALRRELGDKHGVADALDEHAGLAVARGQPRRGAQLFGAADALRQAYGMPRTSREQAQYEQALAAVRSALGEAVCAAAVQEGRALALDEAVALALAADAPE